MGKKKNKGNKAGKRLENPNLTDKKSTAEVLEKGNESQFAGDDSVGEMLNNALILDESTEIVVVTNSNFQNNNEKQQMLITPPQQTKNKAKPESNFITDQDVGANNSNKKSSTSSARNYSCTSSGGDNSFMEKDPFEVSYSRSIEYNSVNKKGTKYVL